MNRKEIVVPRASWNDVFSDDTENPLIPVVPCSTKSRKGPATMHLPCPTFLSKEGGKFRFVGFRIISGIRRVLTNVPIVAGMSGGPVLDKNNYVIGVAVKGAEIMEKAQETENHFVISIDALKFLNE